MAIRAALILGLVLLGCFVWRAWRPLPNLALMAAVVAGVAAVFILKSPLALGLAIALAITGAWVIKHNG